MALYMIQFLLVDLILVSLLLLPYMHKVAVCIQLCRLPVLGDHISKPLGISTSRFLNLGTALVYLKGRHGLSSSASSTSSLTNSTSGIFTAISEKVGAIILHGPPGFWTKMRRVTSVTNSVRSDVHIWLWMTIHSKLTP